MVPQQDPTITRIRKVRHLISERFGHDPRKIVDYYIGLQMGIQKNYEQDRTNVSEMQPEQKHENQGPQNS